MRAKWGTHLDKGVIRAPPAHLHRLADSGTSERQASLDQAADGAPGPPQAREPDLQFGDSVCPDCHTLLQCPGVQGGHFLPGPRDGLKDLTSRTLFGLLWQVSEATLR